MSGGNRYGVVWPQRVYDPLTGKGIRHIVYGNGERTFCGRNPDGWGWDVKAYSEPPHVGCISCTRGAERHFRSVTPPSPEGQPAGSGEE